MTSGAWASEDGRLTATSDAVLAVPTLDPLDSGDPICELIQSALLAGAGPRNVTERRRERRHPFPYPIAFTPVDRNRTLLRDERFVAIGKHLSYGGLDFYYHVAIPYRQAVVALPCGSDRQVSLLIDLNWCRFGSHRWYENGGQFIQPASSPDDHPDALFVDDLLL